jgi:hypothetical protein
MVVAPVSRSRVGFRRNERSAHVNVSFTCGPVQGGGIANETRYQEQMTETQGHTTTENLLCLFRDTDYCIPVAFRVDCGVTKQQQLDEFKVTLLRGEV